MTCTDDTSNDHATHNDIRANAEMGFVQTLTGSASLALAVLSVGAAIETGNIPEQHAIFAMSLTGMVVSTGLCIAWVMLRAIRGSCRERRHQHIEALALSKEQHDAVLDLAQEQHDAVLDLTREQHAEEMALSRAQHAEMVHGFKASGERYAELIEHIIEFTRVQEREAEVIGDVLQYRRRDER